jgi:sterol 3beta-glucosyltransferase
MCSLLSRTSRCYSLFIPACLTYSSLGQALSAVGHRVRLATHETFRRFVRGNGLEFFPLAGDVTRNRQVISEIVASTWRACTIQDDETKEAFTARAIIANPPSFGHVHCAQKLGIPLHIMLTMPWSPTSAFPRPLFNVDYSKASIDKVNMLSYRAMEVLVSACISTGSESHEVRPYRRGQACEI